MRAGSLVFSDPIRAIARSSVARLRAAGTQIVMITGDHPGAAAAIAERLDVLRGGTVITGPQLDDLDDAALDQLLPGSVSSPVEPPHTRCGSCRPSNVSAGPSR